MPDEPTTALTRDYAAASVPPRRFVLLTTLPGHIFRELAKSVGVALLIFAGLLLSVYLGQIFVRDGASLGLVLWIWPLLVPVISPYVLPFAIIAGVLVTYGRLVADREYLAAQAGGVHPLWLAVPAGAIAVVAVFIVVFLNEFALQASHHRLYETLVADQANIIERRLRRPGSLEAMKVRDGITAICRLPDKDPESADGAKPKAGLVIGVFHPARRDAGAEPAAGDAWDPRYPWPVKRVAARDHTIGKVTRDPVSRELFAKLYAVQAVQYSFPDGHMDRAQELSSEAVDFSIPAPGSRLAFREEELDLVPMMRLSRQRQALAEAIAAAERRLAEAEAETAGRDAEKTDPSQGEGAEGAPGPSAAARAAEAETRNALRGHRRHFHETTATLHNKIVLAFSCFCFAFLGVPMGLATGRSGVAVTNFMLGVLLSVAYALLLKMLDGQVAAGRLPWPALWLPNLGLIVLGLLFVRRARRMAL